MIAMYTVPPPDIIEQPEDISIPQDTTVTFNCEATSYGDTTYFWQRVDGGELALSRATGVNSKKLTISNVVPDDTGSYVCVASNKDGKTASRKANLNVEGLCIFKHLFYYITAILHVVAQCPTDLSIDNGYVVFSRDSKLVVYHCYNEFRLIGSTTAECMQNGIWSSPPPECTGMINFTM